MPGRGFLRLGMVTGFVLLATLRGFAAGRETGPGAVGAIAGRGEIRVDNQLVPPGTVVFPGDVVATGKDSTAVVDFRSGSAATLVENSEVGLSHDINPTTLNLRHGALMVRSAGLQPTRISVAGNSVLVQGENGFPALCRIAYVGGSIAIFADRGRVVVHGSGAPVILPAGKSLKLEAGGPQAGGQQAGKVSNAMPEEVVQRGGQGAEISLKLSDPVNWQDLVRTLRAGRVRIELLDGSFLNVGARSTMRIVRHDPQSQQTQVELTLGKLRGEVVKLTKPGANFEVRTQTAVIGVVGTVFLIHSLVNLTRVSCLDGVLSVRNLNPGVVGQVTLRAGQFTTVPRTLPPTGAGNFNPSQMNRQIAQTNAQGGAGVPPGGALNGALNAANTGSNATAAGLSAAAAGVAADAASSASSANQTLETAASTADAAAAAAQQAADTAAEVGSATGTVIDILSNSQPGCGCQQ